MSYLARTWPLLVLLLLAACGRREPPPAPPQPVPPVAAAEPATPIPVPTIPAPTATADDSGIAARPELAGFTVYPKPEWRERPDPLASPDAVPGGVINYYAGPWPSSFNYYLENSVTSSLVFGLMYETMLDSDSLTIEEAPRLARYWAVSEDLRTFVFWLRHDARWSDDQPLTAHDVKYTFDAIMDPANLTGVHKVALERFDSPEILDDYTIRFTAKDVHWQNLLALGSFEIIPAHWFKAQADFNKLNFQFPVVSGPYAMGEMQEGTALEMVKRPDWWAANRPASRHVLNFARIRLRFYQDSDNAFEAFKKGELDYYPVNKASRWATETQGEAYNHNWIVKQRVYNHQPVGFQGFAMNLRREPFTDPRVRQALAHLLDRRKMNETIMHRQYAMHRSYWEDLYSPELPCPNPHLEFDKDKARALLAEAGWRANPATGKLEKDGQPLVVRFLQTSSDSKKFLEIFQQDLEDVGISLTIDSKDWSAMIKDMDEHNFDMVWMAWSASLRKNPEDMWHSKEAARHGSNNMIGYANPAVDKLIEEQRTIFDIERRHDLCRQIDAMLAADVPYILLWYLDYERLVYWNKFGMPPTVLGKYGRENSILSYWWYDSDSAGELEQARAAGQPLPPRPDAVRFAEAFRPGP